MRAAAEVGGAIITAGITTLIAFVPIFTMSGSEGKLFKPLAYTQTFALTGSIFLALIALPTLASWLFRRSSGNSPRTKWRRPIWIVLALTLLSNHWRPIPSSWPLSFLWVSLLGGAWIVLFRSAVRLYPTILAWCLVHKKTFLTIPVLIVLLGALAWSALPREFMPALDEGSFLYMPSTIASGGIEGVGEILQRQNRAIGAIPEVESVVGKLGRVDSPLDPAPLGMIETLIAYKPEYGVDSNGAPVRVWRESIRTSEDLWREIVGAGSQPGVTGAEKLQSISTRLVMLQSGIRGALAIQLIGPTRAAITRGAQQIERLLRTSPLPQIDPALVHMDRSSGNWKPYLLIVPDRAALAQYGISIHTLHQTIGTAIGGKRVGTIRIERQRIPVRVRFQREHRDSIEAIERIPIPAPNGATIALRQVARVRYEAGPATIKSENASLVNHVFFGRKNGFGEVETIEAVDRYLTDQNLQLPAGVSYRFAGTYKNHQRARATLRRTIPIALLFIYDLAPSLSLHQHDGPRLLWHCGRVGRRIHLDLALRSTVVSEPTRIARAAQHTRRQPQRRRLGRLSRPVWNCLRRWRGDGHRAGTTAKSAPRTNPARDSTRRHPRRTATGAALPDDHRHHTTRAATGALVDRTRGRYHGPDGPAHLWRHGRRADHDAGGPRFVLGAARAATAALHAIRRLGIIPLIE